MELARQCQCLGTAMRHQDLKAFLSGEIAQNAGVVNVIFHDEEDYRVAIETGATMLAGERAEPDDFGRLDALVERMWEVDDFEVYRRADIRFHVGLAEAARSPRLVSAMTEIQGRMSELITRLPHPPELLTHSNAQHGRLVRLLRERDTGRAMRLMREHIEGTEHILAGLFDSSKAGG